MVRINNKQNLKIEYLEPPIKINRDLFEFFFDTHDDRRKLYREWYKNKENLDILVMIERNKIDYKVIRVAIASHDDNLIKYAKNCLMN